MKKTLFCIPFAGGSATYYNSWKKDIPETVTIVPLELAGRGMRYSEDHYSSIDQVVTDLAEQMVPYINGGGYALFGHSMGGMLAYYLANKITEYSAYSPMHCFISGMKPPCAFKKEKKVYDDDNTIFIDRISKLGGMTDDVLANKDLLELVLPVIKNDIRILEEGDYSEYRKLKVPITFLGGKEDIATQILQKWERYTTKSFNYFMFDGGHFFLNNKHHDVIRTITISLGS